MADTFEVEQSPLGEPSPDSKRRLNAEKLYGTGFPGKGGSGKEWRAWINKKLKEQEPVMRDKRLHWARHRNFRQGRQWVSSRDGRTWRELDGNQNAMRMVQNMIGPALDFRLGIISQQKPGFRANPLGLSIDAQEEAEAQQNVAEYYYRKLNGQRLIRDAGSNAQTDGVSFLHVFVDKHAGPSQEDVTLVPQTDSRYNFLIAQGYEEDEKGNVVVPMNEAGMVAEPTAEVRQVQLGDIGTRILLAHEVFFDPEAKSVNGPFDQAKWCILRRVRDIRSARLETGKELEGENVSILNDPIMDASDTSSNMDFGFARGLPAFPNSRMRHSQGAFDYMVYIAPNKTAGLPEGMWRRVIGNVMVGKGDSLPGNKIPLARFTDGSTDPEMFPRPVVSDWIPDQITINSLISKLVEQARAHGSGRIMAQKGTIITETFSNVVSGLLEYSGPKPEVLGAIKAGSDIWNELEFFIKKLEDKTGWTDLARGQVTGSGSLQDVSGRAILANKEIFEQQFAPMINATAEGMSEWAKLLIDYARHLFTTPRLIPIVGRGDLAKHISQKELGEESTVYMDAETLMPLPRSLRNQMLFDLYQQGLISADEYKRRAPFAEIRNVTMGDTAQHDRAQQINTMLEDQWESMSQLQYEQRYAPEAGGMAVWWQDDSAIHKTVLLEIVLDAKKPQGLQDIAAERWGVYDQLERSQGTQTDPTTGQPLPPTALPPSVVRGAPIDLAPQLTAGLEGGQGGAVGTPPPGSAGTATSADSTIAGPADQGFSQLGEFGSVEQQAQDLQQG